MNIQNIHGLIHWLEYSSFRLNTEKYVVLTNSLLMLQNENHFRHIFFWGVIRGFESDYYISFGYRSDAIKDRTFFYSENCKDWKLLPSPEKNHLILSELCQRPFQGDPGLVIEVVDDAPFGELFFDGNIGDAESKVIEAENPIGESQSEEQTLREGSAEIQETQSKQKVVEEKITSGELKEEDRLAAAVRTITDEAFVVPRGGLFKQTDGICVHSKAFEGLGPEEVMSDVHQGKITKADLMSSFQHYRDPQQDWNTNLLVREDYNYALDFLDTIDKDVPCDIWTAQLVEGDRAVVMHTLAWPGLTFFHHLSTPFHGCIYIGNGQRNLDIPFMTQVRDLKVEEILQENEEKTQSKEASLQEQGSKSKDPSLQEKSINSKETSLLGMQSDSRGSKGSIAIKGSKESVGSKGTKDSVQSIREEGLDDEGEFKISSGKYLK